MTTRELLQLARARVSRPALWTQGRMFDLGLADGYRVVTACAVGALGQAVGGFVPTTGGEGDSVFWSGSLRDFDPPFIEAIHLLAEEARVIDPRMLPPAPRGHVISPTHNARVVEAFNDCHTHDEVLALFDRVIARCPTPVDATPITKELLPV